MIGVTVGTTFGSKVFTTRRPPNLGTFGPPASSLIARSVLAPS